MGGAFTPRTEAQKAAIPMPADATVALVAATCASISVAPFLMCVDRGVVAAAAGNAPGGSLFRAIGAVAGEFVTKPKVAFGQPAVWIVAAALRRHVLRQKLRRRPHRTPRPLRVPRGGHRQVLARRQPPTWEEDPERRRFRAMVRRRRRRHRRACRHPKDLLRPLRRARLPHHQRRVRRPRRHARRASRARGRGGIRRGRRLAARLPAAHASRLHALTPPRAQPRQRPGGIRRRARRRAQGVHARRAPRQVASIARHTESADRSARRDGEGKGRRRRRLRGASPNVWDTRWVRCRSERSGGKRPRRVRRRRAGRFPARGRRRGGRSRGRGAGLPDGTDARAAQVREHHACDGDFDGSNPNDGSGHGGGGRGASLGSGNGRRGDGRGREDGFDEGSCRRGARGWRRTFARRGRGGRTRGARTPRGMTRDARVAGSFAPS